MADDNQKDPMINIGGLWKNTSQAGKTYLSGYLGNAHLLVFPNNYKKEDKHPDYVMYVAAKKKKEDSGDGLSMGDNLDDIPF